MVEKIVVANQKGGVGKTDLCVNLAAAIASAGKKVLVIDLDPQANTTSYLTSSKTHDKNSYTLLMDKDCMLAQAAKKTLVKNLWLVPSCLELSKATVELASDFNMNFKLKTKLREIEDYDYIFIDTPPSLGVLTVNALASADKVIVPLQTHYFAMEGVSKIMDTIAAVKENINSRLELCGVVLTMFDKRTRLSGEVKKMAGLAFGEKVFNTYIPTNVRLAEAPSHHKPIIKYSKKSRGALAYLRLAEEFLG